MPDQKMSLKNFEIPSEDPTAQTLILAQMLFHLWRVQYITLLPVCVLEKVFTRWRSAFYLSFSPVKELVCQIAEITRLAFYLINLTILNFIEGVRCKQPLSSNSILAFLPGSFEESGAHSVSQGCYIELECQEYLRVYMNP